MSKPQETIIIPAEAVQVLINALVRYPYDQVAPVLDKYRELISEANRDKVSDAP